MFRVLEVPPEGPTRVVTEGTGEVGPPPEGRIRWVDLQAQDDESLALLKERFAFHPLAIEDCAHFDQRAKLEEYGDHMFVVTHGFSATPEGEDLHIELRELHAFVGSRYLVTVHAEPLPSLEEVWKRVVDEPGLARRGPDFLYYLVSDATVDDAFPIVDRISDALDQIEEDILGGTGRHDLPRIFGLKHELTAMRHAVSPQRDVFAILARHGDSRVSERTSVYFRDVYDHLVRIYEHIDTARDLLSNALEAYLSMISNRTNEIMKRLTILSAIFLPLAFITGFFGQNFDHLPYHSVALLILMIALCIGVPVGMMSWFRRSGWL